MRGHCLRQLDPSAGPQCCVTHFVFVSTLQILHKIQHWVEIPVTSLGKLIHLSINISIYQPMSLHLQF